MRYLQASFPDNWTECYRERIGPQIGLITIEQQQRLLESCVAVAGCGAVGGYAISDLATWGIGKIKIADLDHFGTTNTGRQLFSGRSTIGKEKVDVVREGIIDISPDAVIDVYPHGVTFDNVENFVEGCDAVIDAVDYACLDISLAIHQEARRQNVVVFTPYDMAFGSSVFVFYPDRGITYEELLGIDIGIDPRRIDLSAIDISRLCQIFPSYVDPEIVKRVLAKEINIPSVVGSRTLSVGITVTELCLQIINGKNSDRRHLQRCAIDIYLAEYVREYIDE